MPWSGDGGTCEVELELQGTKDRSLMVDDDDRLCLAILFFLWSTLKPETAETRSRVEPVRSDPDP
jgi:hypothetical protein